MKISFILLCISIYLSILVSIYIYKLKFVLKRGNFIHNDDVFILLNLTITSPIRAKRVQCVCENVWPKTCPTRCLHCVGLGVV